MIDLKGIKGKINFVSMQPFYTYDKNGVWFEYRRIQAIIPCLVSDEASENLAWTDSPSSNNVKYSDHNRMCNCLRLIPVRELIDVLGNYILLSELFVYVQCETGKPYYFIKQLWYM